jgi:hypothetical protein
MRFDIISVVLIGVIIVSSTYIIFEKYKAEYNECTANPLTYASKRYEERYGHALYGEGSFQDLNNKTFFITFNTSGVYLKRNPTTPKRSFDYQEINLTKLNETQSLS